MLAGGSSNLSPDVDFVTVMGTGSKRRRVPSSFEGRKILFRYIQQNPRRFVFGTRNRTACTIRNLQRDFALLCRNVDITGVRCSFHALRHTFAVFYLRKGGNLLIHGLLVKLLEPQIQQ